jgi:hypothetical protein
MPGKNPRATIYSEKIIQQLNLVIKAKVAEVRRLQHDGILPYAKKHPKMIVETSDLILILGKTERTAQRHMARIRKKLGKKKGEYVSVKDFIKVTGLDEFTVQQALDLCPLHELRKEQI